MESGALPFKSGKYLTFRVARQDFAMLADCVRGILPMHEMSLLHAAHPWLLGFAAVAGRDFPVVDLRAKLGIAHGSQGREPFVVAVNITVDSEEKLVGFVADRVSQVVDVRAREFRRGLIRAQGRPRKVLDPASILLKEEWAGLLLIP